MKTRKENKILISVRKLSLNYTNLKKTLTRTWSRLVLLLSCNWAVVFSCASLSEWHKNWRRSGGAGFSFSGQNWGRKERVQGKDDDQMKETEKTRKTRNREHKGKREEKAGGSWKPVKPLPVIAFFLKKAWRRDPCWFVCRSWNSIGRKRGRGSREQRRSRNKKKAEQTFDGNTKA